MSILDKLQQVWQSQCTKPLDINPSQLLGTARLERRAFLVLDVVVIVLLSIPGTWMLGQIRDIRKDWPWIIYSACIAWVIGFMLFNQWRRRRHAHRRSRPAAASVSDLNSCDARLSDSRVTDPYAR